MRLRLPICLLGLALLPVSLFAQAYEVSPYAGFYWPGHNNQVGEFRNNHTLGVRGGAYISSNLEIGGNYNWSNHFQPSDDNAASAFAGALGFTQGAVRSHLWEGELTYNFGKQAVFGSAVKPYLTVGAGGLTTNIRNNDKFVLNVNSVTTPTGTQYYANDVLSSGDTFFTFSYGGGVKAARLWGPVGFFGDFRGRTLPNFFNGHGTNWPEISGGLYFAWGESK